jgi:magnesium-transporting ATPase (P-type)
MEIVKMFQTYFIYYDEFIFDIAANKATIAKTSELIEELGQVEFIFSDKTGTLTQNVMEFKKCFINGRYFGELNNKEDRHAYGIGQDISAYKVLSEEYDYTLKAYLDNFFKVCTLCHSALSEQKGDTYIYSSPSPDEIALINGAKDMGYIFVGRTTDTIDVMNIYTNRVDTWDMLMEIPFDSDRKRMTMLVRNRAEKNNVYILTKGADNIMLPLINIDEKTKKDTVGNIFV